MLKRWSFLIFALLLIETGAPLADGTAQLVERPNVLFIAIDDLNDWVGFLSGHPQVKTPHMDRLAGEGVVFSNAHCAAPLCAPSRAAVFSGKQPFHSGVYENQHNIRSMHPQLVLLPQHFKANGYGTWGTGKLLHRRSPELFDDSFFTEQRWSPFTREQVDYTPAELPSKGSSNPRHVVDRGPGRRKILLPLNGMPSDRRPNDPRGESFDWGPVDVADVEMGDAKVAGWAAERLRQEADGPFFLAVGFYRPHIPLFAPEKYFEMYPEDSIVLPEVLAHDLDDLSDTGRKRALEAVTAGSHGTVLKYEQWEAAVAGYLACVSFVDAQLGRLLDALEEGPHADNTIIVLWGDHGWHLGEKQHWGKWTGWERSTRVPLIVVPPKRAIGDFQKGTVSRQPVGLIDLYPTLIEMCRLEPRPGLDGASLVPFLRDPATATQRPVITTFGKGNYSVRDRRWRLIRYADGSEELYDSETDPMEWANLSGNPRHAPVKSRLAKWLPEKGAGH